MEKDTVRELLKLAEDRRIECWRLRREAQEAVFDMLEDAPFEDKHNAFEVAGQKYANEANDITVFLGVLVNLYTDTFFAAPAQPEQEQE